MRAEPSTELLEAPDPRTSHRLFQIGLLAVGGAMVALTYKTHLEDVVLIAMGNLILGLGALPALNWARKGVVHFPVFEMFMLTTIPFYAVSLLTSKPEAMDFPSSAIFQAAVAVVVFQVSMIAAFGATKREPGRNKYLTTTLLPEITLRYAQTGIWIYTAYLYVNAFTWLIPRELATAFRAIFSGIGMVCLFIETRRWGAKLLKIESKTAISAALLIQLVILFRDLYLITGISTLLLALVGYVSTSRRVPLLAIGCTLPIIAILHSGKSTMRLQYWEQRAPAPDITELPDFFQRWFEAGLEPPRNEVDAESASLAGRLFERASLFQMLCLVTDRTPEPLPYLAGESYSNLPAQLVPSFLWPGKPSSLQSNVLLAVYYRLVPEDNPTNVSIAFGIIAEAYSNFGLIGCAVLGALLGFIYKCASAAAVGCPQFSALGLLTILLTAWSFQVEQIFATWVVSFIQAASVVIGLPLMFWIFFKQE